MIRALFSSAPWMVLESLSPRAPSRCPYCPTRLERHWVKSGSYRRWAPRRREKIRVQCYYCPVAGRWFSLLPDALLPYRYRTAAWTLKVLDAILVRAIPVSRLARLKNIARTTLRRVKAAFLHASERLRLPDHEGVLAPAELLRRLARRGAQAVVSLFAGWKELEPKHSILGFYAR